MIEAAPSSWHRSREMGLAILILLIASGVAVVDAAFLSSVNVRDILVRSAPTVIIAAGVMLVMITGEIDISVGSLFGLLASCLGVLLSTDRWGLPVLAGVPLLLCLGTSLGLLTGVLVTYGRVPSIIATLGLLSIFRGATTLAMSGENIAGLPEHLTRASKVGWGGVPLSIWVAAGVVAGTAFLLRVTPWGQQCFAAGSNPATAATLGLPVRRLKLGAFAYVGLLTAVAVVVDVPRLPKIEAGIGVGLELLVVTCVVVGGVSITGGRGSIGGVLLAVVLMTMVRPVLTFLDVGEEGEKWTKAIQGAFIMLAVIADRLSSRRPRGGA